MFRFVDSDDDTEARDCVGAANKEAARVEACGTERPLEGGNMNGRSMNGAIAHAAWKPTGQGKAPLLVSNQGVTTAPFLLRDEGEVVLVDDTFLIGTPRGGGSLEPLHPRASPPSQTPPEGKHGPYLSDALFRSPQTLVDVTGMQEDVRHENSHVERAPPFLVRHCRTKSGVMGSSKREDRHVGKRLLRSTTFLHVPSQCFSLFPPKKFCD